MVRGAVVGGVEEEVEAKGEEDRGPPVLDSLSSFKIRWHS